MNRYLLFSGAFYYPEGGAGDFVKSFATLEEAEREQPPNDYGIISEYDGVVLKDIRYYVIRPRWTTEVVGWNRLP